MLVMVSPLVTSHVQQLEFGDPVERGAYWVLDGEGSNQAFKNPIAYSLSVCDVPGIG